MQGAMPYIHMSLFNVYKGFQDLEFLSDPQNPQGEAEIMKVPFRMRKHTREREVVCPESASWWIAELGLKARPPIMILWKLIHTVQSQNIVNHQGKCPGTKLCFENDSSSSQVLLEARRAAHKLGNPSLRPLPSRLPAAPATLLQPLGSAQPWYLLSLNTTFSSKFCITTAQVTKVAKLHLITMLPALCHLKIRWPIFTQDLV